MNRTIVRVKTSKYITDGKLRIVKDVYTLKKLSSNGYDLLREEISCVGCDINLVGLDDAVDGIYELVVKDVSYCIESGMVDNWDLHLIPYDEGK